MRSLYALLTGALGAAVLWIAFRPSDTARAATGNEDPRKIFDPSSDVRPPNKAPESAGRFNWRFFVPTLPGGEAISKKVKERIDARVSALERTITSAADRFSVPTDLLAVVLHEESRGQLDVMGDGGASVGVGQIKEATQNTVNRYWGTDLDRTNWVENVYLAAGYLGYLHQEMYSSWWPGTAQPLENQWYHATRGYLCGKEGAEEDSSCGSQEASHRLATAGLSSQIPT